MTRRRPGSGSPQRQRAAGPPAAAAGSIGFWYAALIGAVLLVAMAIYAAFLQQQADEARAAIDQMIIGQDLLRADRDELLQKMREREATLATAEATHEQDRTRLRGLEAQRRRLQGDVLRLTQELARSEQQSNGRAGDPERAAALLRLEREGARLGRQLSEQRAEMATLETALAAKERELADQAALLEETEAQIETMREESAELESARASVALDVERLERRLAERRQNERRLQIVRGHRASLGDVRPYIAEVGPESWRVIESWLALQLRRPMAVPDLAAHGWSYEGARLLGTIDGPPMAMLLYADAEERPASLTIAMDAGGEQPLEASENGGLTLLAWQEERHAFFLAGEAQVEVLKAVAIELQNQPPMLREDAPVPISRYVRPSFRPTDPP